MDRATLHALDRSYLDANRLFMAASTRGEYLERRQLAIACCGLPVQSNNWGFLKAPYEDVAAAAEAVRAYFTRCALPYQ